MHINHTSNFTIDSFSEFLRNRLHAYYSAGVPELAKKRLETELPILSESLDEFLLYYELSETATQTGHILQVAGVSIGSMLIFLLGSSLINPLPAHYYCTHCGFFEVSDEKVFGMDLPEKSCPNCGTNLRRDGFSLPAETLWKLKVSIEYRVSDGFYPFAFQTVKNFFAERGQRCLPLGVDSDNAEIHTLVPIGIAVLPPKKTAEDFPHLQAFLKDGTPCLAGSSLHFRHAEIQRVLISVANLPDAIYRAQAKNGTLSSTISLESLLTLPPESILGTGLIKHSERALLNFATPDYYLSAQQLTFPHNTYADDNGKPLRKSTIREYAAFCTHPIYFPEEVFDELIANGVSREIAMRASHAVRTGRGVYRPEELEKFGFPSQLLAAAKHCFHLFPRASGAQHLISLLTLAKYMKENPISYFNAIGEIR